MKKMIISAAALAAILAGPALAQVPQGGTPAGQVNSADDCPANWKRADMNADGFLNQGEVKAAGALVPTSLASRERINQQEFLTACRQTVSGSKS